MELSFAPMEGITYREYRRLHAGMFPGADRYYAPFIAPDGSGKFKASLLRGVEPDPDGPPLIPQLLCNRAESFLAAARELCAMGCTEINLNAGCPSATVVSKHKGAGMLSDLASLDACLDGIFSHSPVAVSVKTRMGVLSTDEFPAILEIYNKYPISRLIIHCRARSGMYKSAPDIEAFRAAMPASAAPVCYNGDIFSPSHMLALLDAVPVTAMMAGRGAVADPSLFRRLRGGAPLDAAELRAFLDALEDAYLSSGLDGHIVMARLKELWYYMQSLFPGSNRLMKAIYRSQTLPDYRSAVSALFSSGCFSPEEYFHQV